MRSSRTIITAAIPILAPVHAAGQFRAAGQVPALLPSTTGILLPARDRQGPATGQLDNPPAVRVLLWIWRAIWSRA